MLNKFKKILIYTLNIPLYWISILLPKNDKIWIFGSWQGEKYSDNSKYLYEHVQRNFEDIRCIWLTKNKKVLQTIRTNNFEAYHSYSMKGYFFSAIAGKVIVSSALHDVNKFVVHASLKINLWHAITLKKIGCDADKNFSYENQNVELSFQYLKYRIFPFLKIKYDYVIASSQENALKMQTAFNIRKKNIIISGLPRTDILKNKVKNDFTKIAYFPTFRDNSNFNYFRNFGTSFINDFFKKKNIYFFYKKHFADNNIREIKTDRIIQIQSNDVNEFLIDVDILITDYSSIYFDFCLLNRPMIFTPFDLENYIKNDRELYYDYNEVTPGPKCYSWLEVKNEIECILNGQDHYEIQRDKINKKFNKYSDFKNTKRLASQLTSLNK